MAGVFWNTISGLRAQAPSSPGHDIGGASAACYEKSGAPVLDPAPAFTNLLLDESSFGPARSSGILTLKEEPNEKSGRRGKAESQTAENS